MFLISTLFLIATIFAWFQMAAFHKKKRFASFPSRKKLYLLGNLLEFIGNSSNKLLKTFEDIRNESSPVFHYSLTSFHEGYVIVTDPKITEVILSNQKFIDKSSDYDVFKNWADENLFMVSGQKWQQSRKFLTPIFHLQALESLVENMDEQCKVLVDLLKKTEGSEVDVVSYMHLFAMDVICGENFKT